PGRAAEGGGAAWAGSRPVAKPSRVYGRWLPRAPTVPRPSPRPVRRASSRPAEISASRSRSRGRSLQWRPIGSRSPSRINVASNAKKKAAGTMAERADIHDLYERSVQAVDVEVEFIRDTFKALRGREPTSFREDFCGTAS